MSTFATAIGSWAPVLAATMAVTTALTALLTGIALMLHRLARGVAPSRVVWSVMLCTAVALTITQPLRRSAPPVRVAVPMVSSMGSVPQRASTASWYDRTLADWRSASHTANTAITRVANVAATSVRRVPAPVRAALLVLWPLSSATLLLIGVWSYRRQRLLLRHSTRMTLHGHTVFVSPNSGPAVFGVRHPRIVVPRWLLERSADEQRLVIAHEQSHIDARDPTLLISGCVLAALLPWNPFVWYMLSRLRLAIELDCDARVLECGATPRHYGALLIDLSAATASNTHPAPLFTGATAFSHHASHLERRLRRMTDRPATNTTMRRLAGGSLAVLALAAACGAELPTSAELQGMDVAAAQKRAFVAAPNLTAASYMVDGKAVSEQEAKSIAANRIASIEIRKQDKKSSVVRITTQAAKTAAKSEAVRTTGTVAELRIDTRADSTRSLLLEGKRPLADTTSLTSAVILIDDVRVTADAMKKIDPSQIESVQILKGAAAEALYGADGAKGVIRITTKKK